MLRWRLRWPVLVIVMVALIATGASLYIVEVNPTLERYHSPAWKPNPAIEFQKAVAGAARAEISRVLPSLPRQDWTPTEGLTYPVEHLSSPRALSDHQFAALRDVVVNPNHRFDSMPPAVTACLFHPDILIIWFDANDAPFASVTICFTCGEWWFRTATEAGAYPLVDKHEFFVPLALEYFRDDADLQEVAR